MTAENNPKSEATFIVQIKYRENYTWQGNVKWLKSDEEIPFRSALELIKLLDSVADKCEI